uniref:Centrosomal protein 68 n=1 Tax=Malurus cyaneus samueli TaxID=2593467 RepID=A0A8C5X0N8_9PASS
MAVDVGKSPSEASLSGKAEGDGRCDCTDVETNFPELAGSLHQLLGTEEAKPSLQGTESMAVSRHSHLATGVTQGGSSCHPEMSSASGFPGARAKPSGMLMDRAADGGPAPRRVGHRFLSSEEQQVRGLYLKVGISLSGLPQTFHLSQLEFAHPCPSSGLLQPQTPPSPESARQSRSVLSLCALSSEGNGPSEEPSGSLPASTGVPSPVATTATWGAEGRALQRQEPLGPLLDYRSTVGLIREISSYQADYWACAIPDSLPPSPDRSSPHWNPNKEYEDLLDYAYPLKPRYRLGRMREPFLHDSGIALDSFSSSPEGTSRSTSIYGRAGQAQGSRENGFLEFMASADRFSTPKHGRRGCSGAASSHPSRGFTKDVRVESAGLNSTGYSAANRRSWAATGNPCPNYTGQAKSTNRFLPTTGVLPLRKDWEAEEEFLSLPPRLQELERLAQFLSNLSLTIRTPGHDHHNLPHHSTSRQPLASRLAPFGEARGRDERENIEGHAGLWQCRSSQKPSWENTELYGWIHRDPLRGLHLPKMDAFQNTTGSLVVSLPHVYCRNRSVTPFLCFVEQMFCCQLEELIRWLYNVAYVTGTMLLFSLPCQEFRKDVADHRSLTESVLERGEALLDCMASNSPALKDTLGLIAKQSEELESHAERFYQSILAAVGPVQGKDAGQDEEGAAHGCSMGKQGENQPCCSGQRGEEAQEQKHLS